MEKDDELKGSGNSYDFGARIYDPRIGRWLGTDNLLYKYPDQSPYNFCINNPIYYKDVDGNLLLDADGNPIYTNGPWVKFPNPDGSYAKYRIRYYYTNDGERIFAFVSHGVKKEDTRSNYEYNFDTKEVELKTTTKEIHVRDLAENHLYDCHAYVLLVSRDINNEKYKVWIFSYYNNNAGNIKKVFFNENEYLFKTNNIVDAHQGDIAVFVADDGTITHSSIYNGNGTFTTKDENDPLKLNSTLEEQESRWGKCVGFYSKVDDKKVDVKSTNGEVKSERKILKAG